MWERMVVGLRISDISGRPDLSITAHNILHNFPTKNLLEYGGKDYDKLFQSAIQLRAKIEKLQEKSDKYGLEYRVKVNLRKKNKGKLRPIYFTVGDFICLSEKEVSAGKKNKVKPRWCSPYQVVKCIYQHLYEAEDIGGKQKVRHSVLMITFVQISFLPNAATTLVYRMDKGKSEVSGFEKLMIKEEGLFIMELYGEDLEKNLIQKSPR
eukprot:augustus_masked-scaffold_3-processed-gene-0.10-mRNA-1 protein AED:1.00 eAED:1.00 QI:0/0/0/0/1/1/2/0/208